MFYELVNRIVLFINETFGFEELNGDFYPKNYIVIINKNGKKEVLEYE